MDKIDVGKVRDFIRREPQFEGTVGHVSVRTAQTRFDEGCAEPDPEDLSDRFPGIFFMGMVTAVYAPPAYGKSILALQLAEEAARKDYKTVYIDAELSDKQFAMRAVEKASDGSIIGFHAFPDKLSIAEIDFLAETEDADGSVNGALGYGEFDKVISEIGIACETVKAQVVVIDNITTLTPDAAKQEIAGRLMQGIINLKRKYGWALLLVTHVPKQEAMERKPITLFSMSGASMLGNALDYAFSIGMVDGYEEMRYIIQTKSRSSRYAYPRNKVLLCRLGWEEHALRLIPTGQTCDERSCFDQARFRSEGERQEMQEMRRQGKTVREISQMTGKSVGTVSSRLREADDGETPF